MSSAQKHQVPVELLAGVIANEMIDYPFREWIGENYLQRGDSLGPAQIHVRLAEKYELCEGVVIKDWIRGDGLLHPNEVFRRSQLFPMLRRHQIREYLNDPDKNIDAAGKLMSIFLDRLDQKLSPYGPYPPGSEPGPWAHCQMSSSTRLL